MSVTAISADRFTVSWVTDEASDTRGEVGSTRTATEVTVSDRVVVSTPVIRHEITFTSLTSGTLYYFRVYSVDGSGNRFSSGIDSARTLPAADTTPPDISSIAVTARETQARIRWLTASEPGDSRVVFGTDSSAVALGNTSVARVVEDAEFITEHNMVLTGLRSGTKYWYRVQSADRAGNRSTLQPSRPNDFTTAVAPDVTPPVISSVSASVTPSTATIEWRTDEPSHSAVRFDTLGATSSGAPSEIAVDPTLVTLHKIHLTNLIPGKVYRYRVYSVDAAGNQAIRPGQGAPAFVFRTQPDITDNLPPALTERPSERYLSNNKVIITWITDEASDDRVYYRKTSDALYREQVGSLTFRTRHEVTLSHLDPLTTYNFVIGSRDAAGNELRFPNVVVALKGLGLYSVSGVQQGTTTSFTTQNAPDTQAPVFLSGPTITNLNASSATIQWTTNEVSTSAVNFGINGTTGQRVENGALVTTHTVTLTGLAASTVYTYTVASTDPVNNGPTTSAQAVFQTLAQPDVTPPTLSAIGASSTLASNNQSVTAFITWTTNEAADSRVEYGTTTALGQSVSVIESSTGHSVTLSGLTTGTTYYYRVASTDASGNGPSFSSTLSFNTPTQPDTQAPTLSGISSNGTAHDRVQMSWTTDEPATSVLIVTKPGTTDTVTVVNGTLKTSHTLAAAQSGFIAAGTAYSVRAQSVDLAGNATISAPQNITTSAGPDTAAPPAPASLTADPGNRQAKLTWRRSVASDLAGYDVYLASTRIASGVTDTTLTVTGLTNDVAVSFSVRAVDQSGNQSAATAPTSVTPSATQAPSAPAPLGTFIAGVAADTVSLKPILVISNATPVSGRLTPTYMFAVYSDTALTSVVASVSGVIQGTSSNPTHWQVVNPAQPEGVALLDNTRYYWRARASDTVADGEWSARQTFFASNSRPTAIQLAGMTAESVRGIVVISWKTFDRFGLDGFRIYRSLQAAGPFELLSTGMIHISDTGEYRFEDRDVQVNQTYYYQIEAINSNEEPQRFGPVSIKVSPPSAFALGQNFPNPFNPTTTIRYELPKAGEVTLVVYNLLGQEVVTLVETHQQSGFHTALWNGLNEAKQRVASGVYFYRISVRDGDRVEYVEARKMLLLK